jgi:pentose-5-phosphate-3-epimerase
MEKIRIAVHGKWIKISLQAALENGASWLHFDKRDMYAKNIVLGGA